MLEQANANAAAAAVASDNAPEPKSESQDLKTVVPTSEVVVNEQVEKEEEKGVEEPTKKEEAFTGNTNGYNSDTAMDKLASSRVQVADIPAPHEPQVLAENSAEPELSSQMHNAVNDKEVNGMELSGTPQSEKPLLKVTTLNYNHSFYPVHTRGLNRPALFVVSAELQLKSRSFDTHKKEENKTLYFLEIIISVS